jgi:hypothetical protein
MKIPCPILCNILPESSVSRDVLLSCGLMNDDLREISNVTIISPQSFQFALFVIFYLWLFVVEQDVCLSKVIWCNAHGV